MSDKNTVEPAVEAAVSNVKTFELSESFVTGDGRTLNSISLRKGTVRDMRNAQRGAETNAEYEVNLITSLTVEKLTPEDLDNMDMNDYGDIQKWLSQRKSPRGWLLEWCGEIGTLV